MMVSVDMQENAVADDRQNLFVDMQNSFV